MQPAARGNRDSLDVNSGSALGIFPGFRPPRPVRGYILPKDEQEATDAPPQLVEQIKRQLNRALRRSRSR